MRSCVLFVVGYVMLYGLRLCVCCVCFGYCVCFKCLSVLFVIHCAMLHGLSVRVYVFCACVLVCLNCVGVSCVCGLPGDVV